MTLPLPLSRPVIINDSRRELNRLLAQCLANSACGQHSKAHEYKLNLIDMLHQVIPNPRT